MDSHQSKVLLILHWLWKSCVYLTPNIIKSGISYVANQTYFTRFLTHQPTKKLKTTLQFGDPNYSSDEDFSCSYPVPFAGINPEAAKQRTQDLNSNVDMTGDIPTETRETESGQTVEMGQCFLVNSSNSVDTNEQDSDEITHVIDTKLEIQQTTLPEQQPTQEIKSQVIINNENDNRVISDASDPSGSGTILISKAETASNSTKAIIRKKVQLNKQTKRRKKDEGITEESAKEDNSAFTNYSESRESVLGLGRGIEGANNSCYLDSTLFSMFFSLDIFDSRFLQGEMTKDSRDVNSDEVTNILTKIVRKLRAGYCPSEYTAELRSKMRHINNRLTSTMMDVDELISNLCGKALHLQPFIKYSVGTTNYLHQILINPSKKRDPVGMLQDLLVESMQMQGLKLASLPEPALIIKMPRSNGQLVGHGYIFPNLTLDVGLIMAEGTTKSTTLDLMAVIVLKYLHYTTFVRRGTSVNSPWVYFNSMPANITRLNSIGDDLEKFETAKDFRNVPTQLKQIMGDIHVCIYQPNFQPHH